MSQMNYDAKLADARQVAMLKRAVESDAASAQKDTVIFAVLDTTRRLAFVMRVQGSKSVRKVADRGIAPVWQEFQLKPKALNPNRELTAWFSDLADSNEEPAVRVIWRGITTVIDAARRKTEAIQNLKMDGFRILNVRG